MTVERSAAILLPQGDVAPIPNAFVDRLLRELTQKAEALRA